MKRFDVLNSLLAQLEKEIPSEIGYKYGIDYHSAYGGYRLVLIKNENGAHYGCFGGNGTEKRVPFQQMCDKIRTIIYTAKQLTGKI